jgi:hypothetical protein
MAVSTFTNKNGLHITLIADLWCGLATCKIKTGQQYDCITDVACSNHRPLGMHELSQGLRMEAIPFFPGKFYQ